MPMSYDQLADEVLVQLLQSSDEEAFRIMYRRHVRQVFRLALSKVQHVETAEDITQQVFLSIWERRQQNRIVFLEAYLKKAVKLRCISHYVSKYANTAGLESELIENRADPTTEEALHFEELKQAVYRAMDQLPAKTREVFQLSRFHNHTNWEIAQLLKISEKAVEYHMTQSLKVMRRELKDYLQPAFPITLLFLEWFT